MIPVLGIVQSGLRVREHYTVTKATKLAVRRSKESNYKLSERPGMALFTLVLKHVQIYVAQQGTNVASF